MCIDDIDRLLPRKPEPKDDKAIGALKRKIACLQAELNCYRELMPGFEYSPKHNILVGAGLLLEDD